MKKRKRLRLFRTITLFLLAFFLAAPGLFNLIGGLKTMIAYATEFETVSFTKDYYDASDSNIVYATLRFEGAPNTEMSATYRTFSNNAIEGIDYQGVYNSVKVKIPLTNYVEYQIAVKILNDINNRETIRVKENDNIYARHFTLSIVSTSNCSIGSRGSCKCYLPYEFEADATTGATALYNPREVAYLNDYKTMLMEYDGGREIDGKETYRTWHHNVSFDNDTTKRWASTYIKKGIANAYGSFLIKEIDDMHGFLKDRDGNVSVLAGNGVFIEKYDYFPLDNSCPGLYFYAKVDPPGKKIDGNAMYYMSRWVNPYKKDDDLVDVSIYHIAENHTEISWILDRNTWFSSKNSIYTSTFYKLNPYHGTINMGVVGYNHNGSNNMDFKGIWEMVTLHDNIAPRIVKQYSEFVAGETGSDGSLRIYIRFNEPVYSSKKNFLTVKINNYSTKFYADYLEGNYSDTLVYEIPYSDIKNINDKITAITYELPNDDIGDMAYNMDTYKEIQHNMVSGTDEVRSVTLAGGLIDLTRPSLNVDIASSTSPHNAYNIILSTNNNGATNFNNGVVYYKIDKSETISNPTSPSSYDNVHTLTSEEQGSFTITLVKNESAGITSGNYYIHALAVSNYGFTAKGDFGPYRLDGDIPNIEQLTPITNELKNKEYIFKVKDKELGTPISNIDAVLTYEDNGVEVTKKLPILVDGAIPTTLSSVISSTYEDGVTTYHYKSNIDADITSIPLDTFILSALGEKNRLSAEIHFEVMDEAFNKGKSNSIKTIYDTRGLFENVVTIPASYVKDESIATGFNVYNIANASSEDGITFSIENDDYKALIDGGAKFSVTVNDNEEYIATDYSVTLKNLRAGYYEVVGHITGIVSETEIDMVSKTESFYLTDGFEDNTENKANISGNLVLTNHVYQLNDAIYYYYNPSNSSVESHAYGATYNSSTSRYEGGSTSPAFSNNIEAKKYIKYMEYQDLEMISISDTIANLLNSGSAGSTAYVKATGETTYARGGQLWIRYKKSSWSSSLGANGWCFYYYGEGSVTNGININGLSTVLSSAIDTVVNRIVSNGQETYLVDEDNLHNVTYAPYLAKSQMHVEAETVTTTKSGNTYVSNPTYAGDANLYQNNVSVSGNDYPLATNLALSVSDNTTLYYKYIGSTSWTQIDVEDGTLLKDALGSQASSGIYTIREYDENGVSEFDVYFDNVLPSLNITYNVGLDNETSITLDGSDVTTISGANVSLDKMVDEIDDLAYVAIYSYPNRVLRTVLYRDDINGYFLSGGNFYLQVGDRSGNIITYTILTTTSNIDISAEESESKTSVVVKVSNRDDSEIYSYEVYLNEVLIDNEFAPTKIYRESGIYRIEIVDIYGNSETKIITHESPSPSLTWYYLNDNGGYSVYDENNPIRMILQDSLSSSRTTNVYSSTLVRILFDNTYEYGEVEFELTGLDSGDYSYNESTGLLSINSLSGWSLRVWYSDSPDSDHVYNFIVDATAPEAEATFIGSTYQNVILYDEQGNVIYTSSLDGIDIEDLTEGDVVYLSGLQYTVGGLTTIDFTNNSVISANRVVIALNDPSGIKNVTVTRNGQNVEVELNENNELILNSYGSYSILVSDNLGNVSNFNFINVDTALSNAAVDGELINTDVNNYGHDYLEVETLYDESNLIYVNDGENTYTYRFDSDMNSVTFGQYVVVIEKEIINDEIIINKTIEYKQNPGFILYKDEDLTKVNTWYTAIEEEHFMIYAMIDENGRVHVRVCCLDREIVTEIRYEVGNTHLPDRYIATLSKEEPSIILLTDGEVVEIKEGLEYIYVADDITIDANSVSSKISTIEYSYSEHPEFNEFTTIYDSGEWLVDFVGSEYGFYQIIVTDVYKNQRIYNISKIDNFASVVTIYTLDGSSVIYHDHEDTIYANYMIGLDVYSDSVYFEVNGVITSGYVEGGVTSLTLNRDGTYLVKIIADNGVTETLKFEIKADETFLYQEEWITGYNEDALLYDQGYTNQSCSIHVGEDVVFIDMVINDEEYIKLYDCITADKMMDETILIDAIGRYGVGKYEIGFRNKYGDLVKKTVYFNNKTSLVLTRLTTNDPNNYQVFDIETAVSKGFYSNYVLAFSTTSEHYVFTINGVSYRLDETKKLEFTNASGTGSFSYRITYLDEYGNYLEFDAILYRADVDFDVSSMNTISLNGSLYTRDDICITFAEGLKATVSIDGAPAVDYQSGEMRFADGEYRFVIRDIAGNVAIYVINHKSVNHYTLTDSSTGNEILAGGVINNGTVIFTASDDSKILYVVRNGELVSDFNSNTFSVTGHYEVIIEDSIGNKSYESFYVINNSLCEFTYDAPLDYEITEVWRVNEDGSRELLNYRGPKITLDVNGDYVVVVTSIKTASSFNFTIGIDRTEPTAILVGAEEGGVTAETVTLSGLKIGDTVQIYKDGELISTTVITISTESPSISTGGRYRVVITNKQGMSIEYNFTRKAITNVAGSIFIIVSSALLVTGIGIGLIYHTKLRTDD